MKIKVGSKVAYSVQFLASIGMSHSDMAHARGVVTELRDFGRSERKIAVIDWKDEEIPNKVTTSNLALVGPNSRFCKC